MIHNQPRDAKDTRHKQELPACRVSLSLARRLHFACSPISPILETAGSLTAQKLNYMVFSVPGHRGPLLVSPQTFRAHFYEWLFGPEKFSGLSRSGPQVPTRLLRKRKWSYRKLFCFSEIRLRPLRGLDVTMRNSESNSDLSIGAILQVSKVCIFDFLLNYRFEAFIDGFGQQTVNI